MKGIKEFEKLNEMNYEKGMSNRYILYKLRENREKLIRLYAQLVNNNKASWKVYDSMIFEIEDARDNIYPNWKENLIKADEEKMGLIQIGHISSEIPGMKKFVEKFSNLMQKEINYIYKDFYE